MKSGCVGALVVLLGASIVAEAGCGSCGAHEHKAAEKEAKTAAGFTCPAAKCMPGVFKTKEKVQAEAVEPEGVSTISTAGLAALKRSGVQLVLVDARTEKYDDGRRIPGAKSLPAGSSPEQIAKTIPDKDGLVVTYCSNLKCQASPTLAKQLRELGYSSVIEYPNGIDGWEEAGQDIDKIAKN